MDGQFILEALISQKKYCSRSNRQLPEILLRRCKLKWFVFKPRSFLQRAFIIFDDVYYSNNNFFFRIVEYFFCVSLVFEVPKRSSNNFLAVIQYLCIIFTVSLSLQILQYSFKQSNTTVQFQTVFHFRLLKTMKRKFEDTHSLFRLWKFM